MKKPTYSFWQIWNMSFGFLGIQFGWGLQMANMSPIYEYLGASVEAIPMLWLAAPVTGLLVQPIIGHLSDNTWTGLGRRRPYFLLGAILSSLALLAMPHSSSLWMAAGLLWILDASINLGMETFRAFVGDQLDDSQATMGFSMQSVFIGLGAVIASALPWLLIHMFNVDASTVDPAHPIPLNIRLSFYIGAAAFMGAIMWTVLTTKENPPEDLEKFHQNKRENQSVGAFFRNIKHLLVTMPKTMRQLAAVQFFTWMGLFCMWMYYSVAVAHHVFGATDQTSPVYHEGVAWAGICNAAYSLVCFFFSFAIPPLAMRFGRQKIHFVCLWLGAAGLISTAFIHTPQLLLLSMMGVGMAWAATLALPYSMLVGSLPKDHLGVYMGIFNFFIVLPQIVCSLLLGRVMKWFLGNDPMNAVLVGGGLFLLAGLLALRVQTPKSTSLRAGNGATAVVDPSLA